MQWLENTRDRLARMQKEIKSQAVGGIVGWLSRGFTLVGPGEREREREVFGQHSDSKIVLFAKFFIGPLDAVEMFLPFFHVSIINIWKGAWEGLDQSRRR